MRLTNPDMKLANTISKGIFDCFSIWEQELQLIRKDLGVVLMFIIVPIVYPVLYGLIYNTETISETPLAVVDESHSALAREFVRKIDASPDVRVFAYAASLEEAKEWMNRKKIYGILLIPSDFNSRINRGEQAVTAYYADMSSILFYQAALLAATDASLEMGKKIHIGTEQAIKSVYVPLYNPQKGFASFLLPAILILVIQQTLLLGIGILSASSRERNRGYLIPCNKRYEGTLRIVFGKALAYLVIYISVCIWALVIVPHLFKIPQLTNYGILALFVLPFLLSAVFFSMTIASFIRGRETPMMVLVFTSLIFLFISGVSWPLSAMPDYWKYLSYLIPSTFGIQGFIKLNSMGAGLWEIAFEYRMLWLLTGFYFITACLIYRRQIIRI
jgi:ABC-2 type transport system permease protein